MFSLLIVSALLIVLIKGNYSKLEKELVYGTVTDLSAYQHDEGHTLYLSVLLENKQIIHVRIGRYVSYKKGCKVALQKRTSATFLSSRKYQFVYYTDKECLPSP